ncbi:bifunctional 23S rRNA (guanine(2069)-N(7))-methyltransferase RlmK/23S rRNA (guanine(2445)-N(2))-methyltransferase RlmL [Spiribacter aquaticus]|uniref:Ribosomal RNA large subunit methyltransferase K/L n=1 Tax=Spiribacter aquaticus TaxID=1935996 RepID=A0A557RJK8_9GAMM|nr:MULTISPECIES: bifunctional 23S rRNA (guanine(2069)-N(7))-methyltransferase RlmK/23S rRNA (guanine(2445)-N(2))-methyltransferase RlmL [Spiribacter]KAF0280134.1 23S rRNA (guanine(2445)-N(2))/(guanine(2069)-N(7))-methyltransferase [Spiribacter roseus]TVO65337.1 bifunctional 23S rRNA (guanine(2069)-N(7))-methyltransferase RlmK/23S rRNA (guanine(2445)-N(2))-methyltransferase RlmL [Spiribacter aquaticus]
MTEFFATAPRGFEELLAAELRDLGLGSARVQRGGVAFTESLAGAYRACLWSRLANRILLPIAHFEAQDEQALYTGVQGIDWSPHLGVENTLAVDFTGVRARIAHSRFAQQRVKDAVVDQLRDANGGRPSVDTDQPDVRVNVHMMEAAVTVAIDLSGESLHQRGYRREGRRAPLKENVAAAMLLRGDWPALAAQGGALIDPMCGSGTLLIEAAWMATDTAPGLLRTRFGFHHWRGHDDALWKPLIDEALERQERGAENPPTILGFDQDEEAVATTRDHLRRAGLADWVPVECAEVGQLQRPADRPRGLVITNPPYGQRLAEQHELVPLYLSLGQTLKTRFAGWRAMVLNGSGCALGLKPERSWQVFNGPIECRLERFELQAGGGDATPAQDLVNRLHKNQRQLKKWLAREDVYAYRVYDADIPGYALAVDVYNSEDGRWLHVQEYAAPATVDAGKAQARLRAALSALPGALDTDPSKLVYKVRQRQRGEQQYQRLAEQGQYLEVQEGPCRLLVNLTDRLDTGLFLDHRPVRQWIGENARGKHFLNLYAYTGAATVHAGLGGAASTTSVDLSKTYLAWLQRNLHRNQLNNPVHALIQEDVMAWLKGCDRRYDLIFLDPPSFSSSKRMAGSLDIQRDHVALIQAAAACLSEDGLLIFSTNRKGFRLDPVLHEQFSIEDRTAWSIPKDFQRRTWVHGCWFIRYV